MYLQDTNPSESTSNYNALIATVVVALWSYVVYEQCCLVVKYKTVSHLIFFEYLDFNQQMFN